MMAVGGHGVDYLQPVTAGRMELGPLLTVRIPQPHWRSPGTSTRLADMTYFVTGATGFIGRFLLARLLERDGTIYVAVPSQFARQGGRSARAPRTPTRTASCR